MRYCFHIAPLHWDLWGGRFRAADSYHIAGVIPSNFQYEDWFQSKLITVHRVNELYIYTKFYQRVSAMSDLVVDFSHLRGWSFPCASSRCYKPTLYHHKHKSSADKALTVHFFSYFSYGMTYCFLIAALHWDLWGGRFCAADSYHIPGVICSNFQYNYLFQLKLISAHRVNGFYICTKFYQGMSTMSDPVVVYSHVRGWSFPRGLSRCYKPIFYHEKMQITRRQSSYCSFFLLYFLWHELLLPYSSPISRSLGWSFPRGWQWSHSRCDPF